MAEILVEYSDLVLSTDDGRQLVARACGSQREDGKWQGWIEFVDPRSGEVLRSGRETTQPNRDQTVYWATGLTPVYLEGALERALEPLPATPVPARRRRRFPPYDEPARAVQAPGGNADAILNPFSVYLKGEPLLRNQLAALSAWHLINIIRAYDLSELPAASLNRLPAGALVALIVEAVRQQTPDPKDR